MKKFLAWTLALTFIGWMLFSWHDITSKALDAEPLNPYNVFVMLATDSSII